MESLLMQEDLSAQTDRQAHWKTLICLKDWPDAMLQWRRNTRTQWLLGSVVKGNCCRVKKDTKRKQRKKANRLKSTKSTLNQSLEKVLLWVDFLNEKTHLKTNGQIKKQTYHFWVKNHELPEKPASFHRKAWETWQIGNGATIHHD